MVTINVTHDVKSDFAQLTAKNVRTLQVTGLVYVQLSFLVHLDLLSGGEFAVSRLEKNFYSFPFLLLFYAIIRHAVDVMGDSFVDGL